MTGGGDAADPRTRLAQAWAWHRRARADAAAAIAYGMDEEVARRLRTALLTQETRLRRLTIRMTGRDAPPVVPPHTHPDPAGAAAEVHDRVRRADDAIDATEEAGTRPRRLASWPVRPRNALVYLAVAAALSTPAVALVVSGRIPSGPGLWALAAAQCLVLPPVTVAIGQLLIGRLFRPWLGGPTPRLPAVGTLVALTTHTAVALATMLR